MSDDREDTKHLLTRFGLAASLGHINVAAREMTLVARHMTVAMLALIKDDDEQALNRLEIVQDKLDKISEHLDESDAVINGLLNASK